MTTLARLSFWGLDGQLGRFEEVYATRLVPLLREYGLEEAREPEPPTAPEVFSRLFVAESPACVWKCAGSLPENRRWLEGACACAAIQDQSGRANDLRWKLDLHSTPAGPGRTVPAGPGYRQGLWLNFSARDGFVSTVNDILQDRQGYLWFAGNEGLCRYDGASFTTFTRTDGLPTNCTP